MNIPETIKIAGYTYKIERPDEPFASGCNVYDGLCMLGQQCIKVAKVGNEAYQHTIFLHEVIHGIIDGYCGDILSDADEEKLTTQLAKGLYQVITDNPEVFK